MTAPGTAAAAVLAHGQAEYERCARQAEPWRGLLPAWGGVPVSEQAGWRLIESQLTLGRRDHCFCEGGPRVIAWSGQLRAWAHSDGYQCPDSTRRPAPETAEAVLF